MRTASLGLTLGVLAGLWLCGSGPAPAQSASATLAGAVVTESGKPVPDAVVQARADGTGTARSTVTDGRGRYRLEGLSPGSWTVVARVGNSGPSDSRSVVLHLQQTTRLDFAVSSDFSAEVVVRAESPLVDRKETAGKLFVSGERADQLPVAGRVFTDLALLDSAVRPAAPGNQFGERGAVFTVNGQGGRSNSFLVDGMDNNDLTSGTALNSFFSQQVIQEFVLLTNQFAPEFGRASGGILNIVTRRGTNDRAWDGFVQGTEDSWNETGDFVAGLPDSGESQQADRRLQAGLAFGGPFVRDRAFYFAAYEHQQGDAVVSHTGIGSDGIEGGRSIAPTSDDSLFLRTDFNLGRRQTLMVRLSADDRSAGGVNVGGVYTPEAGFRIEERDYQLLASLTAVASSRLLSETRVLASSSAYDQFANSARPGVNRPQGIFGGNILNRQRRDEDKFQLVQNFTVQAGAHTAKFGVDVIRSHTRIRVRFNPLGSFTYNYDFPFEPGDCGDLLVTQTDPSSVADDGSVYCVNDPNGVDDDGDGVVDEPGNLYSYPLVYTRIRGEPEAAFDDTRFALFAQDRLELGRRWVLDYGLRYDLSSFELPGSARVDSTIPNGGAKADTDNLAPRFGFTVTPRPGGRSVIRGGAGVFYDKLVLAFPAVAAITSGTSIGLFFPQGFAFEFTEDDVGAEDPPFLLFPEPLLMRFTTATELETPYTVQVSLGFERGLGSRAAFRADLIHSLGYHLPLMKDLNPVTGLVPGLDGLPLLVGDETRCPVDKIDPTLEVGVPCHAADPEHGSLAALVTEGRSWYTGLDLSLRWQRGDGWWDAGYTLSEAEDQGFDPLKGGIYLPPDSTDLARERGRVDSDRRHRVVLSGGGGLPWLGVRASAVVQLSTGIPFNVTTGQDDNLDGILSDRPPGVDRDQGADSSLDAINAVRDQPVVPLEPVDSLREPSFFQLDARLSRPFLFDAGKGRGELFVQAFNLFDRENEGLIEGRAISPAFGRVISLAGPPRTLELGLKIGY